MAPWSRFAADPRWLVHLPPTMAPVATSARPERFAGMHFFNPVDRMQLVEVIRGEKTSDQTVATLVALAKRIG